MTWCSHSVYDDSEPAVASHHLRCDADSWCDVTHTLYVAGTSYTECDKLRKSGRGTHLSSISPSPSLSSIAISWSSWPSVRGVSIDYNNTNLQCEKHRIERQGDTGGATFSPCLNSSLVRLRLLSLSQALNRSIILRRRNSMNLMTTASGLTSCMPTQHRVREELSHCITHTVGSWRLSLCHCVPLSCGFSTLFGLATTEPTTTDRWWVAAFIRDKTS